jgi:hypothetical protein
VGGEVLGAGHELEAQLVVLVDSSPAVRHEGPI